LIEFLVQSTDMTIKQRNRGLGLIANTGPEATGVQGVAEAIRGTTGLLEHASLLIHKSTIRPGDHHIPCMELRGSRAELPNGGESQGHISAGMAFRGGFAKSIRLLTPHKRDIRPAGRTT
jgi:hypothetical protein